MTLCHHHPEAIQLEPQVKLQPISAARHAHLPKPLRTRLDNLNLIWTWLDFIVFIITYPIKIWVLEFRSQYHQLDWTPIKHPSRAAAEENFPAPQGRGADTREQRHPDRRDSRNSEVWWSLMSCWFRQIPHDPTVPAVLGCLCLMCSLSPLSRLVPRSRTFWPALRHRRHPVDEILSTRWNEAR